MVPTFTYLDQGFDHILPHWYQLFIFAAIPLLALYNGEKGSRSRALSKFFYWFYPGHLMLLYLLQLVLG